MKKKKRYYRLLSWVLTFMMLFNVMPNTFAAVDVNSESHIHTEEFICPGGELNCDLKEAEGHIHSETCYAKGGELICSRKKTTDNKIALYGLKWDGSAILTAQDL